LSTESLAPDLRPGHPPPPRKRKCCAMCGQPSGSVSAGTGKPLVRDRATGELRHVVCIPSVPAAALAAMVDA